MDNPNVRILEKKHICSFCDFKTHKKYNLDLHMKNKHGNNKNGVRMNHAPTTVSVGYDTACNKCGETAKFYYCGHCNYATKRKYNLKVHMERKHSNTKVEEKNQIETFEERVECNNLVEAVEVLKIYKLLQRIKNN